MNIILFSGADVAPTTKASHYDTERAGELETRLARRKATFKHSRP